MDSPENLDWVSLLRVDSKWITDYLLVHNPALDRKLVIRSYSLRFAGTEEHLQGLVEFMSNSIKHYVFSDSEIKELERRGKDPWKAARNYFGAVDPLKDGKCGELLLFLVVEAVLKTPLIAHKIRCVSDNPNDQAKGSDGVFIGSHNGYGALLFGEAKIHADRSKGINKALESVNKFHDGVNANTAISNELIVVRERLTKNLSMEQLKFLENALDTQSEEYRSLNKVHPILIVYDSKKITEIERNCSNPKDGEELACKEFTKLTSEMLQFILEKLGSEFQALKKIYLDFFFIPVSSVDNLRESFFKEIHGMPYPRTEENNVQ